MAQITAAKITTNFIIGLLVLLSPALSADRAKILLIPGSVNSHVLYFTQLGVQLSRLGHRVEVLVPANCRAPDFLIAELALTESQSNTSSFSSSGINFTYIPYPVEGSTPFMNSPETSEALVDIALSKSLFHSISRSIDFGLEMIRRQESDCNRLLENDRIMERIRAAKFDFAIVDPVATTIHCIYALPYSLGVRYATLSIPNLGGLFRVPRLPSFSTLHSGTDRMSFTERLWSLTMELLELSMLNRSTHYVELLAPTRPPLNAFQLLERASLWFYLEDLSTSYAKPQMPNTAPVGDIMAGRPGHPLPEDLEEFISTAPNGVIVVSFGSFLDYVPQSIVDKFCEAFHLLQEQLQLFTVWKLNNADGCRRSNSGLDHHNLLIRAWIPQNDLLADPRVRLFVSHGGLNSLVEAVYHAKPLVLFPITFDQPLNAATAESKGYAIRMDLADFNATQLVENVRRILTDPAYGSSVRLASEILRDKADTPAERVSRMIEHVVKYGDDHLRTGAFELNIFEFWMFDVFLTIVVAILAFLTTLIVFVTCCWRCCVKRAFVRKSKTD